MLSCFGERVGSKPALRESCMILGTPTGVCPYTIHHVCLLQSCWSGGVLGLWSAQQTQLPAGGGWEAASLSLQPHPLLDASEMLLDSWELWGWMADTRPTLQSSNGEERPEFLTAQSRVNVTPPLTFQKAHRKSSSYFHPSPLCSLFPGWSVDKLFRNISFTKALSALWKTWLADDTWNEMIVIPPLKKILPKRRQRYISVLHNN